MRFAETVAVAGWGQVIRIVSIPFTAGLIWVRYMEDASAACGRCGAFLGVWRAELVTIGGALFCRIA